MIKVSDFLGKPLISLCDAKAVGFISNVWFNGKFTHAKTAEITSDDDGFPERTFAELRNMQCEGDAAIIKSLQSVSQTNAESAKIQCIINRQSFNQSGRALGKVRDILLENRKVVQIVCEKATFTPKELLSLGDNICIFNDTGAPIKLARPKKTARPAAQKTHPAPPPAVPQVQTPTVPQSVTVTKAPGDPVKDYSFLLGKPVRSPVVSRGKIIIPAGTVVTEKTIEIARKENKLVQLALRAYE